MNETNIELNAILDRNLANIIGELGLTDAIESGSLRCPQCGRVITFDNIAAFKVTEDGVSIYCDDHIHFNDLEKE